MRFDVEPIEPGPNGVGDELGAIVGPDVVRYAVQDKEISKTGHHIITPEATGYQDRQTFTAVLVDHHQHFESLAVVGAIMCEVVAPNMVLPGGSKPDAGTIVQPKPSPLGL